MRRPLSLLAGLFVSVAVAVGFAPAATAAGTGGVELTPLPTVDAHGHPVTAFHVAPGGTAKFALRNLTDHAVTVRMYGAAATKSASGAWSVGRAGSADWLDLPAQDVTLAPHAIQTRSFTIAKHGIAKGVTYGAVVLEQSHGTVVERAATLVYLKSASALPKVERAVLPVVVAAALIGVAVVAQRRVRSGA